MGRNRIPAAYADEFTKYGLKLSDVVQVNKPAHTGADMRGRLIRRARFDGEVVAGAEYILIDDTYTMGGTLRDLKDYIESKGGKVVEVTALAASRWGTQLRPTEEQIRKLKEKGIEDEQLREIGIADDIAGLTRAEAQEILVLVNSRGNQGTPRGREAVVGADSRVQKEARGE